MLGASCAERLDGAGSLNVRKPSVFERNKVNHGDSQKNGVECYVLVSFGTVIMRSGVYVALILIEKLSRCAQGRPVGRISEQLKENKNEA